MVNNQHDSATLYALGLPTATNLVSLSSFLVMTHVRHIWHMCMNVTHFNNSQVLNMTGASLPVLQSDMFTRAGLPNLQRLFLRWTQIQWQWQWQIQWQFRGCSLAQPPWADLCYISFLTLASITVKLTFASPKLFILSWIEKALRYGIHKLSSLRNSTEHHADAKKVCAAAAALCRHISLTAAVVHVV